jgi:putative acetyltransferase
VTADRQPRITLEDGVHSVRPSERERVLEVWEASVRATHTFLAEADIQFLLPLILNGVYSLPHLLCVRDHAGQLLGFVGVDGQKMEALFVHPSWRGMGIGYRLARYAIKVLGVNEVDVNEQNEQAVGFYRRLGFEVFGRSELDGQGKPFPLLHMRLAGSEPVKHGG